MAPQSIRPAPSRFSRSAPTPRPQSLLRTAPFRVFGEAPPFRPHIVHPTQLPVHARHTPTGLRTHMSMSSKAGKVRTGVLLWALGVPIPLILLFWLMRGCV